MFSINILKKIIPADQAVANRALSKSLQQVKRIFDADFFAMAQAVGNLETTGNLDLINGLTNAQYQNAVGYYSQNLALGTGPGNTLVLGDVIGVAAGFVVNEEMPIVIEAIGNLDSVGALNSLTSTNGVYDVMQNALAGVYGNIETGPVVIPSPLPGNGTYGNINLAFSLGLIPAANSAIANITVSYPTQTDSASDAWFAMSDQLVEETLNRSNAGIIFGNLEANQNQPIMAIVNSLQDYGLDILQGGTASFFESVANLETLTGQAVVATMREGRNIERLNNAGIILDTQLSGTPPLAGTQFANLLLS